MSEQKTDNTPNNVGETVKSSPEKIINKKLFIIAGIVVAVIIATVVTICLVLNNKEKPKTEDKPSDNITEVKKDPLSAYDLLNDSLLKGFIGNGSNLSFFPKNSEWGRLLASKIPLKVGESYIETFDRDYFDTRLRAQTMGFGVTAKLSSDSSERAGDKNSLVIDSTIGKYTGVYLKGMKFAANATYQIEFDYRILKASDDFFFQFRADSDGKSGVRTGDKFATITGGNNSSGVMRFVVKLDNFQDYSLMLFPRNNSGKIAIDNIKITRLSNDYNTLNVGQTIREDFDGVMYLNVDKDATPNSGLLSGNNAIDGRSLYIEAGTEYKGVYLKGLNFASGGKYRIKFDYVINEPAANFYFQMISKSGKFKQFYSFGDELVPVGQIRTFDRVFSADGNEAEYLLQLFSGAGDKKSAITIDNIEITRVDPALSVFTLKTPSNGMPLSEDFENGLFGGQLLPTQHSTGKFSIIKNNTNALEITMPDKFSGVEFANGLNLVNGQKYTVSFDYKVSENPNLSAFYVQCTGGVDFAEMNALTQGKSGRYEATITAGKADGEKVALEMFSNQPGLVMVIDNLKIEVAKEVAPPQDIVLNVGDKYTNDFDANNSLVFDIDNAPSSIIGSNANTIDKNSLILNSNGDYKGIYIKGIKLDNKGVYHVRFDYKVLERQDVFYFQFVSGNGAYTSAAQFADSNVALNKLRTFDQVFTLNTDEENIIMQMFPGGAVGNSSIVIDDFMIERLDKNASVFTKKEPTESNPVIEDFENGLYNGQIMPNQQGTGTFDIVSELGSNALQITMPDAFSGVQFINGLKLTSGEKYNVTFDYKVIANPNNSVLYVQLGGVDYHEQNVQSVLTGQVKTTLTCGSANGNPETLQLFSNQNGLKIVVDNIKIEKFVLPKTPLDENFDEMPSYNWAPNNSGIVSVTSDSDKMPSAGSGSSLFVNCVNNYDGLIMTPKYSTIESGKRYDISFDIKALNVPKDAGLYIQSGGNYELVPVLANMDQKVEVTLTASADNIQLFTSVGGLQFTLDNWSIKPHVEQGINESFDDLNNLSVNLQPNGGGLFSQTDNIPDNGSGKGLYINCVNAFDGIQIKPKTSMVLGDKYEIIMKYKVVANPNGSSLYIQYGSNFEQVSPLADTQGIFTVKLVAGNTDNLQMFSSASGLELVIDDLIIRRATTDLFYANFDNNFNNFIINSNNEALLSSCFIPNLRPLGATSNSLMVTSTSAYGGVILTPKNFTMNVDSNYRISFRYRILENPSAGPLYIQLGAGKGDATLDSTVGHSELVIVNLKAGENLIQMFGGSAPGIKFTLDDFVIEKIS